MEAAFRSGDRFALFEAISHCATYDLVLPEWVAVAFLEGNYFIIHFHSGSLDDAFGRPHKRECTLGLIDHARVLPGNFGWQSAMTARPELKVIVPQIVGDGSGLRLTRPAETIVLRNAEKQEIDYSDTPATRRMRRNVETINEALCSFNFEINIRAQVHRVFNVS